MSAPVPTDPASASTSFLPKTFTVLRGYDRRQLAADVQAGIVVGIVAIPLAIAFAIASGVAPEQGFVTAVVAGFLISLLGGSRVQIGGPTGAFVVVVLGIVERHGAAAVPLVTVMAGVLLALLGFARFGGAIKFIPYPVVAGFTSGIAVIILSSQVNDLLGLGLASVPAELPAKWLAYARGLGGASPPALAVGALSLAILIAWPRVSRRVPAPLVAILVATAAVALLGLPVDTIGSRFGAFAPRIPAPALPDLDVARLRELAPAAVTVALLAGIESLLSAVIADGMIGARHKSNVELVAQGVANVASGLFGGMPATGAIARTATSVKNGGRTPVAGMVHAVTVLVLLSALGRFARLIPLATLAAILVVVAYHMSEWRGFVRLLRAPRSDVAVLLATFLLTVLVDLTVAVQVGVVLAAFLFIRRMADATGAGAVRAEMADPPDGTMLGDAAGVARRDVPAGVEIYEVNGPFFFAAAGKLKDVLTLVAGRPRVFVLRLRNVPVIDATGMRVLDEIHESLARRGTALILSGLQPEPRRALERSGRLERLGADRIAADIDEALAAARAILRDAGA